MKAKLSTTSLNSAWGKKVGFCVIFNGFWKQLQNWITTCSIFAAQNCGLYKPV